MTEVEGDVRVLTGELKMAGTSTEVKKTNVLKTMWEWWKRTARKIGEVQSRIILVIFYFVLLMPFALLVKWGSDPLGIKKKSSKGWQEREEKEGTVMEKATRQF
jgi:hypothetical protein